MAETKMKTKFIISSCNRPEIKHRAKIHNPHGLVWEHFFLTFYLIQTILKNLN